MRGETRGERKLASASLCFSFSSVAFVSLYGLAYFKGPYLLWRAHKTVRAYIPLSVARLRRTESTKSGQITRCERAHYSAEGSLCNNVAILLLQIECAF